MQLALVRAPSSRHAPTRATCAQVSVHERRCPRLLELSVCIGGAPLRTHSLPPGEFVVAQPGSAFTIKLKNVGQLRTSVEVKVDGQWTPGASSDADGHERMVKGFRMQGGNQAQQFVFAYPPTFEGSTSAAPLPGTSAALGALGSITATAWPTQPKSQLRS